MAESVVNDFTFRIATANGTGSQTSNSIIFRALFHMGLAAAAKNMFPSNIQGLPTWYQIRVSREGYQCRTEHPQVLLALNSATILDDLEEHTAGEVVIDNADFKIPDSRFEGFIRYSVPFDTLANQNIRDAKLRTKLRNLIYVGVLAELFGLEHESILAAIRSIFPGKENVVEENWNACKLGIDYARENFTKEDPYRIEKADQTGNKIFIEGNEASALGVVFGGCTVVAWYPITPASSLAEALGAHLHKLRTTEDGKKRYMVIQAEDELAAIGMALGAGWAGARSMTSSSGPGISLMAENFGLGYFAEIPCVVFDVQRVGPSTGLPTRTQQSDLLQAAFNSHGDTCFPLLLPSQPTEAFEMSWKAFDIAERYQTPTIVMSDLDLGMNTWVCDPLEYPDQPFDRGKVLSDEELEAITDWGRYLDIDGDGIPYRTLPGLNTSPRAAYFTRGSGHNEYARYTESAEAYQRNLDRIARKLQGIADHLPHPVITGSAEAPLGLIAFGSTDAAVQEALAQHNGDIAYMRIRAYPFHSAIRQFLDRHERLIVVEQNQQGQMTRLLRMSFPEHAARIESACHYGGLPISAEFVRGALQEASLKV